MRLRCGISMVLACSAMLPSAGQAQQFPARAVTIVASVPPGGSIDWMSRTVAGHLQKRWGQAVVVENRPGGGSLIAAQQVQKASPDGHTLFAGTHITVSAPLFIKGASFEPGKDIAALTPAFYAPYVIITNAATPARNLAEFVAYARGNPGKLNFAATPSTSQFLDTHWFISRNGLNMTIVPYQGGAQSQRAILANEVQAYFGGTFGLDAQVKAGKITALAVTSAKRFPILPEVPSVKEAIGVDMDSTVQTGFMTTYGTPRAVVEKLALEIAEVVMKTEMFDQIRQQGYEPLVMTPDEWTRVMAEELRRARSVAQAAGIQPQ
jgi:tripartite-type tricarboxylate transporter receptor subunit TctC